MDVVWWLVRKVIKLDSNKKEKQNKKFKNKKQNKKCDRCVVVSA